MSKQLAISVVGAAAGAVVGSFVGATVQGAQLGWAAGSLIGAATTDGPHTTGPRLEDLAFTSGRYGDPIPWYAGHPRLAGQVWWASPKREVAITTEQGKGGGPTNTTYTYVIDVFIGLTNKEIPGVTRIWDNGKLVYTNLEISDTDSVTASTEYAPWDRLTVYTGAADQMPDPTMEAALGVGNCPAYRGRGGVFIEGLQLGPSPAPMRNLTFEISPGETIPFEYIGFAQVAGVTTPTTLPDHEIGDLLLLICKRVDGGTPTARAGYTTPDDGTFGAGTRFRVQWRYMDDDAPEDIPGEVNEVTLAFIYRGAQVVGAVQSLSSSLGTSIASPPMATQTDGGGYVLQMGSCGLGVLSWSGDATLRLDQNDALGGGDMIVTQTGRVAEAPVINYTSSGGGEGGPMASCCIEIAPASTGTGVLQTATLEDVVDDLCGSVAGMPAGTWDASGLAALTKPVRAIGVAQVTPVRTVLQMLQSGWFFDAYLTDKIYFVPRGGAVVATIDADDMGTGLDQPDEDILPMNIGSNAEIVAQASVTYANVDYDYNAATELSDRLMVGQVSVAALHMPVGMTSAEAKGISDAIVLDGYASRITGSFSVPLSYAALVPSDVVTVPDRHGNTYRARLSRRTDEANLLRFEWVLDDPTAIESAGITSEDYTPTISVALPGITQMELLDIQLLRDEDNLLGHYVAATSNSATWPGASIWRSTDDITYEHQASVTERGVIGYATTVLGDWAGGNVFDRTNTLTVNVGTGTLSSSTRAAMFDDRTVNAMLVGSEVIRFKDATGSGGVYVMSNLLRGQLGTEWAMGTHTEGDRVVLLSMRGLRYIPVGLASLSMARFYRGVTIGRSLATSEAELFTCNGVSLKPLAPVQLRALRAGTDFAVTWNRRTRLETTFTGPAGSVVPLGEDSEEYLVEVWDGLSIESSQTVYAQATTLADAATLSGMMLRVQQISATVGAGYVAELELP